MRNSASYADRNYVIRVESLSMTLDLISKAFPVRILRENPLERGCVHDTECLFNTALPLGMRIVRENMFIPVDKYNIHATFSNIRYQRMWTGRPL